MKGSGSEPDADEDRDGDVDEGEMPKARGGDEQRLEGAQATGQISHFNVGG